MRIKAFIIMWAVALSGANAQTLAECQQAAERNYPLIKRMDLITQTAALTVANIQKGWLPQLTVTAQATLQSDVTAFPEQMQTVYQQMGIDIKGLHKDQYRIGVDVQQTVFDGGAISSRKEVARREAGVEIARQEVDIYKVRQRVNELYFSLLLLDQQIALSRDLEQLLSSNEQKLGTMFKSGTAAESDYLSLKAERLKAAQQLASLLSQRQSAAAILSVFCGIEVKSPVKPSPTYDDAPAVRPELRLADSQVALANAREKALGAALLPRIGLFAQGFYGYPGYNMFEDMMRRRWSLNGMIGARLTWNIGALYTRKNDKAQLRLARESAENSREVFLFNNKLEEMRYNEHTARYRQLMADDEEIIALRSRVRKAAESKLAHGIIAVNDLLREINAENTARVQQSMHEIEMLKAIYNAKFTTNN
ncbi:MAG: TolC family protein [Prevotella sp.]|nr:TolC family protein [Prevotella sp.]